MFHEGNLSHSPLTPSLFPSKCFLKSLLVEALHMRRNWHRYIFVTPQGNGIILSFFFFNLTYSRWTSSLPSCLWSQRIFPSLPGSRLTTFLSRCKFSTLTTRQPMVEFYLLTFPRFPLRKKEHKSYFGKNQTHYSRTSRCAGYLLDHSGCLALLPPRMFSTVCSIDVSSVLSRFRYVFGIRCLCTGGTQCYLA